jgi:ligand-binding sensor domain-containing protein
MQKNFLYLLLIISLPVLKGCLGSLDKGEPLETAYDKSITAIVAEGENVWIGTQGNGLYRFDGIDWFVYSQADGLASDIITSLAVDQSGVLWIGTDMGVSGLKNNVWTSLNVDNGLYNNDIRSLAVDDSDNLWIGTRNNRLVKYDGSTFTEYHVNPESSGPGEMGHIHTISADSNGNIWVGSCISGLSVFDGENWIDHVNNLSVFVTSSAADTEGNVWVGHISGLYYFSEDQWTQYTTDDGLINNSVSALELEENNSVWIGTADGLSYFNGTNWTTYTINNGLPDNYITALAKDSYNNLWVGTPNGLAVSLVNL